MSSDQAKLELFRLKQRRERIIRRFWFLDRGQMVCESDQAIRAVAMLSVRIRMLTDPSAVSVAA